MIEKTSGRFIGNIELMDPNDSEGELGIAITAAVQEGHFIRTENDRTVIYSCIPGSRGYQSEKLL